MFVLLNLTVKITTRPLIFVVNFVNVDIIISFIDIIIMCNMIIKYV